MTDGPPATRIAVLTTGRQDWGILRSTCAAIRAHPDLRSIVCGSAGRTCRPAHGHDGRPGPRGRLRADRELEWSTARRRRGRRPAASAALRRGRRYLRADPLDALVLVGDRFETAAAALAATRRPGPDRPPPRRRADARCVRRRAAARDHQAQPPAPREQRGARPTGHRDGRGPGDGPRRRRARVSTTRSATDLPDRAALEADLGLALEPPVVLVTVHPATLDADPAGAARAVVAAMDAVPRDVRHHPAQRGPRRGDGPPRRCSTAADGPRRVAVQALGERRYWGLLRVADAMLGNSSSGLIEAPAVRPARGECRRPTGRPATAGERHRRPRPIRSGRRRAPPRARRRASGRASAAHGDPLGRPCRGSGSRISSPHGDRPGPRASRRSGCRAVTAAPAGHPRRWRARARRRRGRRRRPDRVALVGSSTRRPAR